MMRPRTCSGACIAICKPTGVPQSWEVNEPRPDLEAVQQSFPILRTPEYAGASLSLDTAFIDGAALTVARSSQRYDRQGRGRLRYVDLGLSRGFEADLVVDEVGLVLTYEHLFERLTPSRVD